MTSSYSHGSDHYPPIPVLEIRLGVPDVETLSGVVAALIDTGADITLAPQALLEEISAPELDEVRLRSHWGEYTTVITYLVDIALDTGVLPGVEVVGDMYGSTVLLGRNVLNKLLLLIDGPRQITDILTRRPYLLR